MGYMVFMRVVLYHHVMRFKQKGKPALRFVGPFEILECISKVAYALSANIYQTYNVFHVSLLYKYINDLSHVLRIKDVKLEDNLVYKESSIQILD